jgi:DNA-binding transcriptional ArsR family regulator
MRGPEGPRRSSSRTPRSISGSITVGILLLHLTIRLLTGRSRSYILNHVVNNLDTTFAALADPTRRAILARLSTGRSSVGELASPFPVSAPAISKHLRVLEHAGLIAREKQGRVHHCRLVPGPLEHASEWIETYRRFWERQFDALEAYLKEESQCSQQVPKLTRSSSGAPFKRRAKGSSARGQTRKR